jgi:hypothetical protein
MRRSRVPSIAPDIFFVAQSWADCITNMAGFNLRQAQESLNMIRPYGSIGQFSPNMHDPFSFGTTAYFDPFSRLADLGTYTDQKPKHDVAAMNDALTGATLIIFIGFGYHPSNVDLVARRAVLGDEGYARIGAGRAPFSDGAKRNNPR